MKVIIVGYGQMGHKIEEILLERGHEVHAKIDPRGGDGVELALNSDILAKADGAIEFSLKEALDQNVKLYCDTKIPAVIGTTGWAEKHNEYKKMITEAETALLYGSNFSIGAHLFFFLAAKASALVNPFPQYDILMTEMHHKRKKDSPSGTALTAANFIIQNNKYKNKIVTDKLDRQIEDGELHVASVRGGEIPGTHSVMLDSLADTIEIKHTARSRAGFALGAVLALEWLIGKKGFYSIDDFINEVFKGEKNV